MNQIAPENALVDQAREINALEKDIKILKGFQAHSTETLLLVGNWEEGKYKDQIYISTEMSMKIAEALLPVFCNQLETEKRKMRELLNPTRHVQAE